MRLEKESQGKLPSAGLASSSLGAAATADCSTGAVSFTFSPAGAAGSDSAAAAVLEAVVASLALGTSSAGAAACALPSADMAESGDVRLKTCFVTNSVLSEIKETQMHALFALIMGDRVDWDAIQWMWWWR